MNDRLSHSEKELRQAEAAVRQMRQARNAGEFEGAWKEYLHRVERVWNKSHRAYQDGAYEPWRGTYAEARRTDPLLRYLKQARDADEHTVEPIITREPGGVAIGAVTAGPVYVEEMTISDGVVRIKNAQPGLAITVVPGRWRLLPAASRGVATPPPTEHAGRPLGGTDPVSVADMGLAYYRVFLSAARGRFGRGA